MAASGPAETGAFPVRLVLPSQWGEMDSYGHVNNAVYFRRPPDLAR